ncbi:glycosyltransferase family 2 protein [Bellilinea sp.]|jgi:dolichol-phosphate mannosyltransferase|uniref:Glycosyltransferase n=1 Tax=Bellilinea caldifistulae TaxID=360411 RepID=A0A7C4L299_9CHLR|nr:glycosyltransferase family 2 protein [Bellilinea sp.]
MSLSSHTDVENSPKVDLVIPVYNEEEAIAAFHRRLRAVIDPLPYSFTILYVNDGSKDATAERLTEIAADDRRVTVIELSRNFGHQAALTAGLDHSRGDFVISLDGDGEHPPEMIPQMMQLALNGYEVVLTQRVEGQQAGWFKRWTSDAFYRWLNRLSNTRILPGSGDFRLLSRKAADALCQMREYQRFLRGMVAWMGFQTVILPYSPAQRIAGHSKYSLRKMLKLAADALFSFSLAPLFIGISLGGVFLLLALIEVIYVLSFWVTNRQDTLAPGWSSLMFVLLVVGGVLMITLGIIGVYVGFIFQEVKRRPIYFVRRILSSSEESASPHEQA